MRPERTPCLPTDLAIRNDQSGVALILMFLVPDHMSSDGRVKSIALESLNQVWDVDNRIEVQNQMHVILFQGLS